jgi:hypothetical protein
MIYLSKSEVFVVEQNCVYLDLDGKDKLALHLLQSLKEKWWLMPYQTGISLITLRWEEWLSTLITVTENGGMI